MAGKADGLSEVKKKSAARRRGLAYTHNLGFPAQALPAIHTNNRYPFHRNTSEAIAV